MNTEKYFKELHERGIGIIKGDAFDFRFAEFALNKKATKLMHKKTITLKQISDTTYRIINHWSSLGLINDNREDNQKWRRFSLVDVMWLYILKELRLFGMPNKKLLLTKNCLFDLKGKNSWHYPLFEFYICLAYVYKQPVDILVFKDGLCDLASQYELEMTKRIFRLKENFILINLNKILQEIFKNKDLEPNYHILVPLSSNELTVIDLLQENNYKSLEIIKQDGKIQRINVTEKVNNQRFIDMIKEHDYQKIIVHTEKGKSISIERTIKTKL